MSNVNNSSDDETYISDKENFDNIDSQHSDCSEKTSMKSFIFSNPLSTSQNDTSKESTEDIILAIQKRIMLHLQNEQYIPKLEVKSMMKKLKTLKNLSLNEQHSVQSSEKILKKILDNFCDGSSRSTRSFKRSMKSQNSQKKTNCLRDPFKTIVDNQQYFAKDLRDSPKKKLGFNKPDVKKILKYSADMFSKETFEFKNLVNNKKISENFYKNIKSINQTDLNSEVNINSGTIDIPMDFLTNDNFKSPNKTQKTVELQSLEKNEKQNESDHFESQLNIKSKCFNNLEQGQSTSSSSIQDDSQKISEIHSFPLELLTNDNFSNTIKNDRDNYIITNTDTTSKSISTATKGGASDLKIEEFSNFEGSVDKSNHGIAKINSMTSLKNSTGKISDQSLTSTVVFPLELLTNADFTNTVNTMGFSKAVEKFLDTGLTDNTPVNTQNYEYVCTEDFIEPSPQITFSHVHPGHNSIPETEYTQIKDTIYGTNEYEKTIPGTASSAQLSLKKTNKNLVNTHVKVFQNPVESTQQITFSQVYPEQNYESNKYETTIPGTESSIELTSEQPTEKVTTFFKDIVNKNDPKKSIDDVLSQSLLDISLNDEMKYVEQGADQSLRVQAMEIEEIQNYDGLRKNDPSSIFINLKSKPIVIKNAGIKTSQAIGVNSNQNGMQNTSSKNFIDTKRNNEIVHRPYNQIPSYEFYNPNGHKNDNLNVFSEANASSSLKNIGRNLEPMEREALSSQNEQSTSFMDIRSSCSNDFSALDDEEVSRKSNKSTSRFQNQQSSSFMNIQEVTLNSLSKIDTLTEVMTHVNATENVVFPENTDNDNNKVFASTSKYDSIHDNDIKAMHTFLSPKSLNKNKTGKNENVVQLDKTNNETNIENCKYKLSRIERVRKRKEKERPAWDNIPNEKKITSENVRRFRMNLFEDPVESFLDLNVEYQEPALIFTECKENKENGFCAGIYGQWSERNFEVLLKGVKSAAKEIINSSESKVTVETSGTESESDEEILRRKSDKKKLKQWLDHMEIERKKFIQERRHELEKHRSDWKKKANKKKTPEEMLKAMLEMDKFVANRNLKFNKK